MTELKTKKQSTDIKRKYEQRFLIWEQIQKLVKVTIIKSCSRSFSNNFATFNRE